jgi:MYXO-CTERM domain-containing protein
MYLLALKLKKGSDAGSIRPISITYEAERPMIPIKLTAVAANDDMGVMTWVLGETRAIPVNYFALELNEARINWFNAASNYESVVTAAANEAEGQGFVTELAAATDTLANAIWSQNEEQQWMSFRSMVWNSFPDLFQNANARYGAFSGFWDAVRKTVTLPAEIPFEDFKACPNCYESQIEFSPSAFYTALEADVIAPMREVQELFDGHAYVTRLYSTMSAAEMTEDPLFSFNPELEDVSNVHQADRVIECNPSITQFEAPWRVEFPGGIVVRGTGQDAQTRTWPAAAIDQPANRRILQLSESGPGREAADNTDEIKAALTAPKPLPTGGAAGTGGGSTMAGTGGRATGGSATTGGRATTGGSPATGGTASADPSGGRSGSTPVGSNPPSPANNGSDDDGCAFSGANSSSSAFAALLGLLAVAGLSRRQRRSFSR